MEKILKLYTYIDGINDTPFPSEEYQVVTSNFRSDYKRMGGAPSITCTIMHPMCLDKLWTYGVYAKFNGERFFIKQIPSSSYDNTDARYKHELELVSERIILDNVYVYDVVDSASVDDKPVSNNSKFTFFGTVNEFAQRLNQSLRYSGLDYTIVVDDGITSDGKLVSFENQFFTNALQEIYNIFELPYYFVGKVIHIGYTSNAITHTFKYGQDESLLSIQKQNANHKIVNRVTGVGSSDNIPYYYPNDDEKGETAVLYNNKKDIAYVSNQSKYKKVKLSDIFKYSYATSYNKTLVDEKGRSSNGYLVLVGENVFEIGNVTYPFKIESLSDTMFDINYLGDNLVDIKIDVFRGSEQLMSTSQTGSFSRRYREGNYELRITLHVHIEGVNIESEVNVDDVLKDISLHVYQQTEYKDSWLLNDGEKVNLFDYGLSINGTPSNGDTITFKRVGYIQPQTNLMPSIYRDSLGKERFYNALNETYVSPETDEYYEFENQYVEGQPREHIVNFENVKPSIVGMKNASNQRIDMFLEFAYDENDNDEFDEEGNYLHPYFFAKLRKFDGEYGFNLFDHAIDEDEMVIAMTSGSCGACEFIIGVTEDTQKNIVQVNEYGNLKRDDKGNVIRSGTPQDRQNDTRNNEVWIALKKDINTFGVIMPNAEYKYRPSTDDTFVILHIDLPKAYILAAENNLKEQLIKYMSVNNVEKFNFSISFSRIFFAENPHILAQLDENARIQIEYDGIRHDLYVSSYSYNMSSDKALPEIKVELSDTISVQQNALQNAISEVKQDIMSSVGSADFLKQGLQYFLRKDTNDRTRGKLSSDVGFEVGKYVSGASGAIVYQDKESGQTIGELDKLYVRMKAYFETLEIVNVNTIGGKQILSPAGSIKCIGVEETSSAYRCYFLAEQDGEKVGNRWKIGDQAYSQIFNAKTGVSNKVSNTYYWRLVVGVTTDAIDFDGKQCHYIELSKTDCDNGSDIPMVGDVINHRGSRTDIDRMNFIEWSSVDAFSPNITLFHGVNSYSLDGKAYVDFGVDKTLNKAYMNVYGDMYVGDRKEEQYIRYENGKVTIKGKLEVGTTLSDGRDLEQAIKDAAPEGYDEFVEQVTKEFEAIRNEMDGAIDTWFGDETPTLSNYPAIDWITDSDKDSHLGDLFYANDGKAYRFQYTQEKGYHWAAIDDSEVVKALELAQKALDTADGKRRVFIDKPYPPYDLGDLWAGGSDTPLKRCVKAKSENGSYSDSDWALADDSHAYTDAVRNDLEQSISTTTSSLNSAIQNVESASKTYTDTAKQALQTSINELNNAKANVNDVYSKSEADSEISKAEKEAIDAANKQAQAAIELSETTIKAYADGVVDEEEAARIKQAQENLDEAKRYAEQKAQEAFNSASEQIGSFDYLKAALKESTSIEQGLVQTSLLQLGYTSNGKFVPMSGTNGIYNNSSHGGGVASWWGGGLHDLLDYYDWDGNDWVVKSGKTPPTNLPSGLIRFDGTGYLAKGKFWWDNNGKIYADPTALFLMFDVEDEAKSLSATILSILDKQKEFEDMWLVKKDANGNEYIYSKYHIATQYGMTMYGDATTLNIPSIYNGLPIDGSTIYWENGILKSKGSSGGGSGLDITALQNYLTQNSYLNVTEGDARYLKLSGGTISNNGYALILNRESENPVWIQFRTQNEFVGAIGAENGSLRFMDKKSVVHNLLHDGNYSSYALPLSGGTITGELHVSSTSTNRAIIRLFSAADVPNDLLFGTNGEYHWSITSRNIEEGRYIGLYNNKEGSNGWVFKANFDTRVLDFMNTPTVNGNTIWHSDNDGSGSGLDADLLDGKHLSEIIRYEGYSNKNANKADTPQTITYWAENGGYGSTYGTALNIQGAGSWNNRIAFRTDGKIDYYQGINTGDMSYIGQIAFTSSNVASATKLQTARTIWGQSFDGTGNVSGDISNLSTIVFDTSLGAPNIGYLWTNTRGMHMDMSGLGTEQQGTNLTLTPSGNVGIGTPNPSAKFQVNGNASIYSSSAGVISLYRTVSDGGSYVDYYPLNQTLQKWRVGAGSVDEFFYEAADGSNLARIIHNATTGIRFEVGRRFLSVQPSGSDADRSVITLISNGDSPTDFIMGSGNYAWSITSRNSAEGHLLGFYSALSGQYAMRVYKEGNVLVTGGITMYSDQRKKTILNHVELSLKQIAEAPLIEHYYNSDDKKTTHVGSIAQYWASMNDWFCKLDSEGFYTMEIQNAALASAISIARELDRYETKTDKKIKKLKKRICELEEEVERLKCV